MEFRRNFEKVYQFYFSRLYSNSIKRRPHLWRPMPVHGLKRKFLAKDMENKGKLPSFGLQATSRLEKFKVACLPTFRLCSSRNPVSSILKIFSTKTDNFVNFLRIDKKNKTYNFFLRQPHGWRLDSYSKHLRRYPIRESFYNFQYRKVEIIAKVQNSAQNLKKRKFLRSCLAADNAGLQAAYDKPHRVRNVGASLFLLRKNIFSDPIFRERFP